MADSFDPSVFLKDGVPSDKKKRPSPGPSPDKAVVDRARATQKSRQKEMRSKTVPKIPKFLG